MSAPLTSFAEFLNRWFKSDIEFASLFSVMNLVTLIEKMKNVNILPLPMSLFCLDVIGLHLHIPKVTFLEALGELLVTTGCDHEVISDFFDLLRTC